MRKVFIDNIEVPLETITYNEGLNFNRFFKDTIIKTYRFYLSKQDFIEVIEPHYIVVRDEIEITGKAFVKKQFISLQ